VIIVLTLLGVTALVVGLWWVCTSPLRLAAAGLAAVLLHPALTISIAALIAAIITTGGVLLVGRSLREFGWCLVVVSAPAGRHAR
jgi:hypothetical protein